MFLIFFINGVSTTQSFSTEALSAGAAQFDETVNFFSPNSEGNMSVIGQGGTFSLQATDYTNNTVSSGNISLQTIGGNVGIGTDTPSEKLDVDGAVKATAFIGDGSQLMNLPTGSSLWNDGTEDKIYYNDNVGIGVSDPLTSLHTGGTIIAGGNNSSIFNNTSTTALDGREGIILPGPTSQYLIGVQDGNWQGTA